jgi:hypothetical protein
LGFFTDINLKVPLKEGDKWETLAPLGYFSEKYDKNIIVPLSFKTDLASVPRLPFAYWIAGGVAAAPAVVHDWLYNRGIKYKQIETRKEADLIFLEAMLSTAVPRWKAYLMYLSVRLIGGLIFKK